ncbi:STM4504/CBY_0614 family protein [Deinococcus aestuarii]|uniref:STM4504/CBY_0614 family protein n=1 Tax=Deinococcus aestuarii TaxID=2774531 RepID=UPI001C0AF515|nr:hypothetical protein [Deinococcus aestuarii]
MPIYEPFHKRKKRERGEFPELFQTEKMPLKLKMQIEAILKDSLGARNGLRYSYIAQQIVSIMAREEPELYGGSTSEYFYNLIFDTDANDEHLLSVVELAFGMVSEGSNVGLSYIAGSSVYSAAAPLQECVEELNIRFRESGYGYQFEDNSFIPIDSTFTHVSAVKPAILLMNNLEFKGALDEFLSAFDAYKSGNQSECIRLCGNSIESVLKQIIVSKNWTMANKLGTSHLLDAVADAGLIEASLKSHYTSLFSMTKSGVPTIRNNVGGHGQGIEVKRVPDYMARYVVNMTAATILFLIHAYQDVS